MPENTILIYSFKVIFLHLLRSSISEIGDVKEEIATQIAMQNLILPSKQLLDGWHTSQLHHLGLGHPRRLGY